MSSQAKVYIDGHYYDKDEAKISVYDHGLLYGDGIFEGIRIYNGRVFKLKEHLERLYSGAKALLLTIPLSPEDLGKQVEEAVKINQKEHGYVRLVVTRGKGDLGVNPYLCKKASIIIIVDDIQLYPPEHYQKGINIMTSSVRQQSAITTDPRIKSLNYLKNILAKIEAIQAGCLEAILLNQDGYITECTADNIFMVKNSILYTPHPSCGILEGITRQTVIQLAAQAKIEVRETLLTRYDLYNADECFLTGTGAELIPVTKIDGRTIGQSTIGETTQTLLMHFKEFVAS
jgi:branched-chain amino acid aminotransferase